MAKKYDLTLIAGTLLTVVAIMLYFSISQSASAASSTSSESYWTTAATPMPTPRSEIAGVLSNNKIYIIGGFENGHSINTVEVYDPITDK